MRKNRDNLTEYGLSFHYMFSKNQFQVIGIDSKHLYLLRHLDISILHILMACVGKSIFQRDISWYFGNDLKNFMVDKMNYEVNFVDKSKTRIVFNIPIIKILMKKECFVSNMHILYIYVLDLHNFYLFSLSKSSYVLSNTHPQSLWPLLYLLYICIFIE